MPAPISFGAVRTDLLGMIADRQQAAAEFRWMIKWILIIALIMVGGALAYLELASSLTLNMAVATILGVYFTVLLGCGLFAASFFSDKSGHDQSVADATHREREKR